MALVGVGLGLEFGYKHSRTLSPEKDQGWWVFPGWYVPKALCGPSAVHSADH